MKPCRICGVTPQVEGQGRTWRGTGGYSEPTSYKINHHCCYDSTNVARAHINIVGRTEEHAIEIWENFIK